MSLNLPFQGRSFANLGAGGSWKVKVASNVSKVLSRPTYPSFTACTSYGTCRSNTIQELGNYWPMAVKSGSKVGYIKLKPSCDPIHPTKIVRPRCVQRLNHEAVILPSHLSSTVNRASNVATNRKDCNQNMCNQFRGSELCKPNKVIGIIRSYVPRATVDSFVNATIGSDARQ
jgi:hypothetical protein